MGKLLFTWSGGETGVGIEKQLAYSEPFLKRIRDSSWLKFLIWRGRLNWAAICKITWSYRNLFPLWY